MGQGHSGYLPDQDSVEPLLQNLSNKNIGPNAPTRNFIFLGHNYGNVIGGADSPQIKQETIAERLGNTAFVLSHTSKHPKPPTQRYRFVFLHGCSSAVNACWSRSFGIDDTITTSDLNARPNAVQAFVGYDNIAYPPFYFTVMGLGTKAPFTLECYAWNLFFAMWQSGFTLDDCISYTEVDHPPAPFQWDDLSYWNFGSYQGAVARANKSTPAHLRVWGYCGITRTSFVAGHDNSPHLHGR
jgi:hypothetical protein